MSLNQQRKKLKKKSVKCQAINEVKFQSLDLKEQNDKIQRQYRKIKFLDSYYIGETLNHKLDGQGKLFRLSDKSLYQGKWKQDKMVGCVKIIHDNGSIYYGEVDENYCKNGIGNLAFKNGAYYSGQFKQQQRHGKGEFVTSIGQIFNGIWTNDKFLHRM